MATLFKKKTYKPIPPKAEIVVVKGKRYARWRSKRKKHSAEVVATSAGDRIVMLSPRYVARYRDESGKLIERSTGCKDKQNAQNVLQTWLSRIEKIKAGVLTNEEIEKSQKQRIPIKDVLTLYIEYLRSKASEKHVGETLNRINELCAACSFLTLCSINPQAIVQWMNEQERIGERGASTRNHYLKALIAFLNWCVENDLLDRNPITKKNVPYANIDTDVRRKRRALTTDEIVRLLEIARERPLIEALTVRTGKNKGKLEANVRDEVRKKRELLGHERATVYATILYTGLRKKEIKSLRVGQLNFDEQPPYILLQAKSAKNKKEAGLPIHSHLVVLLKNWLDAKKAALGVEKLNDNDLLFRVPDGLHKILDRDLALAGIAKKDFFGQVDVHALRHTHATQLAKADVSPALAQKSMRHSNVKLTLDVYTHLEREDVAKAIEKLPKFGETDASHEE